MHACVLYKLAHAYRLTYILLLVVKKAMPNQLTAGGPVFGCLLQAHGDEVDKLRGPSLSGRKRRRGIIHNGHLKSRFQGSVGRSELLIRQGPRRQLHQRDAEGPNVDLSCDPRSRTFCRTRLLEALLLQMPDHLWGPVEKGPATRVLLRLFLRISEVSCMQWESES